MLFSDSYLFKEHVFYFIFVYLFLFGRRISIYLGKGVGGRIPSLGQKTTIRFLALNTVTPNPQFRSLRFDKGLVYKINERLCDSEQDVI